MRVAAVHPRDPIGGVRCRVCWVRVGSGRTWYAWGCWSLSRWWSRHLRRRLPLPGQVTFTLEGCDRPPGLTLPRPDGEFICPDADYGTGNQGSNWSELDLVPFRLTARIKPAQTFMVVIAADAEDGGDVGFDQISVPQLNPGLSGPGVSGTRWSGLRESRARAGQRRRHADPAR